MIRSTTALDTALELMERLGLWPLAIRPGSKIPLGWSKDPARPTEEKLRETFAANPAAGLGILLGPRGRVIDIEVDSPEGRDSLNTLFGGYQRIPTTVGWESARGNHYLFNYDSRIATYGKDVIVLAALPGLEIRTGANGAHCRAIVLRHP